MLLSRNSRNTYSRPPVHEVICQLRFPPILSINNKEPADFQEAVRADFPQYIRRQENIAPQITGLGGPNPQLRTQPPVTNYNFLSEDGLWKLNLTEKFIALSTVRYPGWEEFARELDRPLAEFISIYKPAYFERVGLRYVNIVSRQALDLVGTPWSELIAPAYAAPLCEQDVREEDFLNCAADMLLRVDPECAAKIHAGPGLIKNQQPNAPQDPEVKFVLDIDMSTGENKKLKAAQVTGTLENLHVHAVEVFEGAITANLREALG